MITIVVLLFWLCLSASGVMIHILSVKSCTLDGNRPTCTDLCCFLYIRTHVMCLPLTVNENIGGILIIFHWQSYEQFMLLMLFFHYIYAKETW